MYDHQTSAKAKSQPPTLASGLHSALHNNWASADLLRKGNITTLQHKEKQRHVDNSLLWITYLTSELSYGVRRLTKHKIRLKSFVFMCRVNWIFSCFPFYCGKGNLFELINDWKLFLFFSSFIYLFKSFGLCWVCIHNKGIINKTKLIIIISFGKSVGRMIRFH